MFRSQETNGSLLNQIYDIESFKSKQEVLNVALSSNDEDVFRAGTAKKSLRFSSSPLKENQNISLPEVCLSPVDLHPVMNSPMRVSVRKSFHR